MKGAFLQNSNIRIEEHSAGEESLSNTESKDVSETEEHYTIHVKREPLPWSKRGPAYNKPLPGIRSDDEKEQSIPFPEPDTMSPRRPTPKSLGSDIENFSDRNDNEKQIREESSTPKQDKSKDTFHILPIVSSPASSTSHDDESLKATEQQTPTGAPVPTNSSPFNEYPSSDEEAGRRELFPNFIQQKHWVPPSASSSGGTTPSSPTTTDSNSDDILGNKPTSPSVDLELGQGTPKTESPSLSLEEMELGQSPKNKSFAQAFPSQVKSYASVVKAGSKREASPLLYSKTLPKKSHSQSSESDKPNLLQIKYRKDWKVHRKDPVEKHFFPQLFNPGRLQYLHITRKRRPIPKEFQIVKGDEDPGAKYRRDWQAERQYRVYDFFNPQLFDPGFSLRAKIPLTRREKLRRFRQRMSQLGIKDFNSPGARLRLDWATSRPHPIETFFEPNLFATHTSDGESLRADWYSLRPRRVETFYNPHLFDLQYNIKKQSKAKSMFKRMKSLLPKVHPNIWEERHSDPGKRYRDDWQVQRENHVYKFFEPSLFNEKKSVSEKKDQKQIHNKSKIQNMEANQKVNDHVVIPILSRNETKSPLPKTSQPTTSSHSRVGSPSYFATGGNKKQQKFKEKYDLAKGPVARAQLRLENLKGVGETNYKGQYYSWPLWDHIFSKKTIDQDARGEILESIYDHNFAGFPAELRPVIWCMLLNTQNAPHLYAEYELNQGNLSGYESSIQKDVHEIVASYKLSWEKGEGLIRILNAYALHDPETGHSPCLSLLAAPLVSDLPEADAFVLLVRIMEVFDHRRILQPAIGGTEELIFDFENLLIDIDPELAFHLQHLDVIPSIYAQSWYGTCFGDVSPGFQERALDLYLLEGIAALHKIALTLVIENREELLLMNDFASVLSYLLGDPLEAHPDWSEQEWIFTATTCTLTQDQFDDLHFSYQSWLRIRHESSLIELQSNLANEHESLFEYLNWVNIQAEIICWDRYNLAVQCHEYRHEQRYHLGQLYDQQRRIHILEDEISEQKQNHLEEMRRMEARLREGANRNDPRPKSQKNLPERPSIV